MGRTPEIKTFAWDFYNLKFLLSGGVSHQDSQTCSNYSFLSGLISIKFGFVPRAFFPSGLFPKFFNKRNLDLAVSR